MSDYTAQTAYAHTQLGMHNTVFRKIKEAVARGNVKTTIYGDFKHESLLKELLGLGYKISHGNGYFTISWEVDEQ